MAVKHWSYDVSKCVLWCFFRHGFGLTVRGQEHVPQRGGFILASNHLSYLDPPVLGAACSRRLSFLARATLFDTPLLGLFLRAVHVIPLQRGEGDISAMREAVRRLRAEEGVAIFPEGGRQFSGHLGTARRGVGLLAVSAQVPIVPVVVKGSFEALPPSSRRLHRAKIEVAFGPQIAYTAASALPPEAPVGGQSRRERQEYPSARDRHEQLAAEVTHAWHRLKEQFH